MGLLLHRRPTELLGLEEDELYLFELDYLLLSEEIRKASLSPEQLEKERQKQKLLQLMEKNKCPKK
jgi:hypothetical protein